MNTRESGEKGFVIKNPLTNLPVKETPDGISLEGKIFPTKEDLERFVHEHWGNAVLTADVKK